MKLLENIKIAILGVIIILLPVFFLTSFANPFIVPKLALLALGVSLLIFLSALTMFNQKQFKIQLERVDFAIFLLLFSAFLSLLVKTPNKMEALVFPGTISLLTLSAIYYFFANNIGKRGKNTLSKLIVVSAGIVSLSIILVRTGLLNNVKALPSIIKLSNFSVTGSGLQTTIFLVAVLPFAINHMKGRGKKINIPFTILLFVLTIGIVFNIARFIPSKALSYSELQIAPINVSWKVSIETLKESPIFGIGPGNYLTAFSKFRPIEYNSTDLWNIKFSSASNLYLTILTENGLFGFLALVWFLAEVLKLIRIEFAEIKHRAAVGWGVKTNPALFSAGILLLAFLVFPSGIVSLFFLFIVLSLLSSQEAKDEIIISRSKKNKGADLASQLISLILFMLSLSIAYFSGKAVLAEYKFKKSLDAFTQNRGGEAYNIIREVIDLNPSVDRYRVFYSQVNLTLAQTLAQTTSDDEATLEENRNAITQLVQQSIREAKLAVSLNLNRSINWEFLGEIYRSISSLASNAIDFSIQSYSQAVSLDPINPNSRIALGGLYYISDDLESAIESFKLAALVKPDLANAHFNLANAYKENDEAENALREYKTTLLLLNPDSQDYQLVQSELETLQEQVQTQTGVEGDELETPEEIEPLLSPPLDLEEELQPDTPASLGPSPTPPSSP